MLANYKADTIKMIPNIQNCEECMVIYVNQIRH